MKRISALISPSILFAGLISLMIGFILADSFLKIQIDKTNQQSEGYIFVKEFSQDDFTLLSTQIHQSFKGIQIKLIDPKDALKTYYSNAQTINQYFDENPLPYTIVLSNLKEYQITKLKSYLDANWSEKASMDYSFTPQIAQDALRPFKLIRKLLLIAFVILFMMFVLSVNNALKLLFIPKINVLKDSKVNTKDLNKNLIIDGLFIYPVTILIIILGYSMFWILLQDDQQVFLSFVAQNSYSKRAILIAFITIFFPFVLIFWDSKRLIKHHIKNIL